MSFLLEIPLRKWTTNSQNQEEITPNMPEWCIYLLVVREGDLRAWASSHSFFFLQNTSFTQVLQGFMDLADFQGTILEK